MLNFITNLRDKRIAAKQEAAAAAEAAIVARESKIAVEHAAWTGNFDGEIYGSYLARHNRSLHPLNSVHYRNTFTGDEAKAYDEAFFAGVPVGQAEYAQQQENLAAAASR